MENTNKVNNSQINGIKNRYTLGLLATLCLLTSSFGIKAMENGEVANDAKKPFLNTKTLGLTILSVGCGAVVGYVLNFTIKRHKENKLIEELKEILRNLNGSSEENLKEFIETLAELEKISGSSIGKIIDDNLQLHRAARYCRIEAIKALVKKGADIEAKDKHGWTALHDAARYGRIEAIKVLVELGADIKAKDRFGGTALHLAAINGRTEAIKVLKEKGADIEAKSTLDWTPLHWASHKGKTEAIKVLVELGADIEAKIADDIHKGKTASDLAKDRPEILKLLNWAKEYDASEDKKVFMRNLMVDGVEKFVPEILEIGQESLLSEQQLEFNLVVLRALNTAMQKQDYGLINFILNNKLIEDKATLSSFFRQALCIALKETGKKSAFEIFYQSYNKKTLADLLETDTEKFDLNRENTYLKFLKKAAEINKLPIPKGFIGGERTKKGLMGRLNEKSLSGVRIHFAN